MVIEIYKIIIIIIIPGGGGMEERYRRKSRYDGGWGGGGVGGKVNVLAVAAAAAAAMCDHWKPHQQTAMQAAGGGVVSLTRQQTVRCPFGRASLFAPCTRVRKCVHILLYYYLRRRVYVQTYTGLYVCVYMPHYCSTRRMCVRARAQDD